MAEEEYFHSIILVESLFFMLASIIMVKSVFKLYRITKKTHTKENFPNQVSQSEGIQQNDSNTENLNVEKSSPHNQQILRFFILFFKKNKLV